MRANVTDAIVSFETEAPSAEEMRRRIEVTLERYPWLVRERKGRVLGYAYAGAHHSRAAYRWSLDVSAYVHKGERRTELWTHAVYTSLISVLALQGFYNAYAAGTALPNPASVRLHESVDSARRGLPRGGL